MDDIPNPLHLHHMVKHEADEVKDRTSIPSFASSTSPHGPLTFSSPQSITVDPSSRGMIPKSHPQQRIRITIHGMTCSSCVRTIETSLSALPGVERASVNLLLHTGEIDFDPSQTSTDTILEAVEDVGFEAELQTPPQTLGTTEEEESKTSGMMKAQLRIQVRREK